MKHFIIIPLVVLLTLSGCFNKKANEYVPQNPVESDVVTIVDGDVTAGQSTWLDFVALETAGTPATVQLEYNYKAEGETPAKKFAKTLTYDGKSFTIAGDEDGKWVEKTYGYLVKMDDPPTNPSAAFSRLIQYLLVNDPDLTWEIIENSILSSQSGDLIDFSWVYMDYIYKE